MFKVGDVVETRGRKGTKMKRGTIVYINKDVPEILMVQMDGEPRHMARRRAPYECTLVEKRDDAVQGR